MASLRKVLALTRKDLKLSLRDKSVIFWTIIFPIILVLLAAFVWVPSPTQIMLKAGVYSADEGNFSQVFVSALNSSKLFKVKIFSDFNEMIANVSNGYLDAAFYVPREFTKNVTMGFPTYLKAYIFYRDPSTATMYEGIVEGFLYRFTREFAIRRAEIAIKYMEIYAENITASSPYGKYFNLSMAKLWIMGLANPINTSVEVVKPKNLVSRADVLGFMVISVIGIEALFSGLSVGSTAVVEEKEKGTLHRLLASPITSLELLAGKTLGCLATITLSAIATVLVGLGVGAKIHFSTLDPASWLAILHLALAAIFFIGVGLIISIVAKTSRAAGAITMAIAFPYMFTSGMWWPPPEYLPEPLKSFALVNPATIAIDTARRVLGYGLGVNAILPKTPIVVAAAAIVFTIGVLVYRTVLKKVVES